MREYTSNEGTIKKVNLPPSKPV